MTESYLDEFALEADPFPAQPGADHYVVLDSGEDLPARLLSAVDDGHALITLTGPPGTGKSLTAAATAARAGETIKPAIIQAPAPDSGESLLGRACQAFGLPVRETWAEMTGTLGAFLEDSEAQGAHPLLIIDDAEVLDVTGLEAAKLLTTLESAHGALLSMVLVGGPALNDLLGRSALRDLSKRVSLTLETAPLSADAGNEYISRRLALARAEGVDFDPLSPEARTLIVEKAKGIPAVIDRLCGASLAAAAEEGAPVVMPEHVDEAVKSLGGADAGALTSGPAQGRRQSGKERREARRRAREDRRQARAAEREARRARKAEGRRGGRKAQADQPAGDAQPGAGGRVSTLDRSPRKSGGGMGRILFLMLLLAGAGGGAFWLMERQAGNSTDGTAEGDDGGLRIPVMTELGGDNGATADEGASEAESESEPETASNSESETDGATPAAPATPAATDMTTADDASTEADTTPPAPTDVATEAVPDVPAPAVPPAPSPQMDTATAPSVPGLPDAPADAADAAAVVSDSLAPTVPDAIPAPAPTVGAGATAEDERVASALARLRALRDSAGAPDAASAETTEPADATPPAGDAEASSVPAPPPTPAPDTLAQGSLITPPPAPNLTPTPVPAPIPSNVVAPDRPTPDPDATVAAEPPSDVASPDVSSADVASVAPPASLPDQTDQASQTQPAQETEQAGAPPQAAPPAAPDTADQDLRVVTLPGRDSATPSDDEPETASLAAPETPAPAPSPVAAPSQASPAERPATTTPSAATRATQNAAAEADAAATLRLNRLSLQAARQGQPLPLPSTPGQRIPGGGMAPVAPTGGISVPPVPPWPQQTQ